MIRPVVNQPEHLRRALLATTRPVVIDLETTGLTRHGDIVSAGLLIDTEPYILFVRSRATKNVRIAQFRHAIAPLAIRDDLITVYHNAAFDLGFLHREGTLVSGVVHDTELMLRVIDQDRGKNTDVLSARIDRAAPPGTNRRLDYKLKHAVPQLLGLGMVDYPDTDMDMLPYEPHVRYLTSDLLGTSALYEYLLSQLTPELKRYYDCYTLLSAHLGMNFSGTVPNWPKSAAFRLTIHNTRP